MRKTLHGKSMIVAFVLGICLSFIRPDVTVWGAAGKTSLAVSAGSVSIGDTVTVTAKATGPSGERAVATMTVSYDTSVLKFVSCSATYGGGGSSVTATGDSFTITLKAVAAGDSRVSLSASDGVVFDTNEELESMAGSGTTVKVKNAAGAESGNTGNNSSGDNSDGGGNAGGNSSNNNGTNAGGSGNSGNNNSANGGGSGTAGSGAPAENGGEKAPDVKLSADNSLSVLALSAGTLSPAFTGSTVKYTATVPNNVTSLAVTATPVNEKAVVESVTGNNSLSVGENTISVVVRAENGVTATYTIRVTRLAAEEQPDENQMPDPAPEEPVDQTPENEPPAEKSDGAVMVDGVSYQISENFTAEDIPADFEEAAVGYHGSEHKGVNYSRGAVSMLYLKPEGDESAAGKFYIYDEAGDAFYAFVKFGAGEKYVFALPLVANEELQAVCAQNPVQIEGAGSIAAYQENEEFYIFYAMNQDGYGGWYRYDSVEGTHQRFTRLTGVQDVEEEAAAEETVEMEYLRQEYSALSSRYSDEKKSARNLIAILIFVAAVLLIIIINLLLQRRGAGAESVPEDETDDDVYPSAAHGPEGSGRKSPEKTDISAKGPEKKKKTRKRFFSDELDDDEGSLPEEPVTEGRGGHGIRQAGAEAPGGTRKTAEGSSEGEQEGLKDGWSSGRQRESRPVESSAVERNISRPEERQTAERNISRPEERQTAERNILRPGDRSAEEREMRGRRAVRPAEPGRDSRPQERSRTGERVVMQPQAGRAPGRMAARPQENHMAGNGMPYSAERTVAGQGTLHTTPEGKPVQQSDPRMRRNAAPGQSASGTVERHPEGPRSAGRADAGTAPERPRSAGRADAGTTGRQESRGDLEIMDLNDL